MVLTQQQQDTKKAVIAQLLADKEASYRAMMEQQQADLGEAMETQEEEQNLFEDGKVDQSINRVEARASVVEALARDIDILSNLDSVEPNDNIQLGDILETDRGNFIVAVAADEFEVNGTAYRGISTNSPLFKALVGKKEGDSAEVNGVSYTVNAAY